MTAATSGEIESVIVDAKPGTSPYFAFPQQVNQRRPLAASHAILLAALSAFGDELALRGCQQFVLARISIKSIEQREIAKADESRRGKIPPPPE